MLKRVLVLAVVLLILGAIGYFAGVGQALACGVTAVVVYIFAMVRRFANMRDTRRLGMERRRDDGDAP